VAILVDTNVLVYRFDRRYPEKQRIARDLLRGNLAADEVYLPHQAIVEFISAVIRPHPELGGAPLLPLETAHREAEDLIEQFPVLYPDEEVLHTALRGAAGYQLSWYDAHLWAYAEVFLVGEIYSEDFEHGRHYGAVRAVNPFLGVAGSVHELPPAYDEGEAKTLTRRRGRR
jgi:predicted nucleic acid-binding protein